MYAVQNSNFLIIDILLENGADINKGTSYENAFTMALENGELKLVDYLFKHGAKNNFDYTISSETSIYILVHNNPNIDLLDYIIQNEIDKEINYYAETTPIIESVKSNNSNKFSLRLCDYGADVFINNKWGMNSLYYAGTNNNLEMTKYLLRKGLSLDQRNYMGETPFFYIATDFCSDDEIDIRMKILKYLIINGADPQARDNNGNTVIERCKELHRSEKTIVSLESIINE